MESFPDLDFDAIPGLVKEIPNVYTKLDCSLQCAATSGCTTYDLYYDSKQQKGICQLLLISEGTRIPKKGQPGKYYVATKREPQKEKEVLSKTFPHVYSGKYT